MPDVLPADDSPQAVAAGSSQEPGTERRVFAPSQPTEVTDPVAGETRAGHRAVGAAAPGPEARGSTPLAAITATVALALLLAVSAASGQPQTGLALAFVGVVLAWGWPVLLRAPSPSITSAIIGVGAVAISATAGLTRTEPFLRWVPVAVAVSVIAGFFHQLLRRDGRAELTHGAATTVSGLALATVGAPLAVLPAYRHGSHYVLAAGAALGLAALAEVLGRWPLWRRWMPAVVVVVGGAGAIVVSARVDGIPVLAASLLGVLAAGISHTLRRVLLALPGADALQARIAVGATSVLVVGVVVYVLARLYAA
jgi:hypothetical protein